MKLAREGRSKQKRRNLQVGEVSIKEKGAIERRNEQEREEMSKREKKSASVRIN